MEEKAESKAAVINKFRGRALEEIWEEGEKLFNINSVKNMDASKEIGSTTALIEGTVLDNENFYPMFYYNLKKNLVEVFNCTCDYKGKGACSHVVALFCALIDKHYIPENFAIDLNNITLDKKINSLNSYLVNDLRENQNVISVGFKLEIPNEDKNKIIISDIVIRNSLYKTDYRLLPNLYTFLEKYPKKSMYFGKYMKYEPGDYVEEHSRRFLDILREIVDYKADSLIGINGIELPEFLIENLIPLFPYLCENYSFQVKSPEILISKKDTNIIINTNGLNGWYSFSKNYMVYKDKFGSFKFAKALENTEGINILKNFNDDNNISISEKDVNLGKIVYKFGKFVKIKCSESIRERFFIPKKIEYGIFLRMVEGNLTAEVEVIYDGKRKEEIDLIILTDNELEEDALIKGEELLDSYKFIRQSKENIFTMSRAKEIYEFLTKKIKNIPPECHVFYSKNFTKRRYISGSFSLEILEGKRLGLNLLSAKLTREEIAEILFSRIIHTKKYFKLPNGSIIHVKETDLEYIQKKIFGVNATKEEIISGTIYRPIYFRFFLNNYILSENTMTNYAETFPKTDFILRDYQIYGINWLINMKEKGIGGILADDMGLGKTLQILTFLFLEQQKSSLPSLIIVPKSVLYNWENEIKKFYKNLKYRLIKGSIERRKNLISKITPREVVITTYAGLYRDIELYKNIEFENLILDEAQLIKNHTSLTFEAVTKIDRHTTFAVSGTPIENNLSELWSLFAVIAPGYLGTIEEFKKRYERNSYTNLLKTLIKPFILRRMKADVAKELPEKSEIDIFIELEPEQKRLYSAFINEYTQKLQENPNMKPFELLALITNLRLICSYPFNIITDYYEVSAKEKRLIEMLDNFYKNGHRVIIFSQFTTGLTILKEHINKKYKVFYLDGKSPMRQRMQFVDDFNNNKADIFLISLKAGGLGLNITGADIIIHYDPWWNPALEDQRSDRAYRIGQKKNVFVYNLITVGTIEEDIYKLKKEKKIMSENILDGEAVNISFGELLNILKNKINLS